MLDKGIEFELYSTTGEMDGFSYVKDRLDIDNCSAIAIVGGDGSVHEAVNGLLNREDKKKVPLLLLPNGSGNDYARCFQLEDVDQGLEYMKKGHVIKVDVVKIILDYKSEEELKQAAKNDPSINIYDQMRYSAINCSLALSANCAKNARWMKSTIGKHAYTIQTVIELMKGQNEYYDMDIDDSAITFKDLNA